jgi:hypothetical protein
LSALSARTRCVLESPLARKWRWLASVLISSQVVDPVPVERARTARFLPLLPGPLLKRGDAAEALTLARAAVRYRLDGRPSSRERPASCGCSLVTRWPRGQKDDLPVAHLSTPARALPEFLSHQTALRRRHALDSVTERLSRRVRDDGSNPRELVGRTREIAIRANERETRDRRMVRRLAPSLTRVLGGEVLSAGKIVGQVQASTSSAPALPWHSGTALRRCRV